MSIDRFAVVERAIFRAAPPPSTLPPIHRIVIQPKTTYNLWLLNPAVLGVMVHYDREERRTYPCGGDECWADHAQGRGRWQGWIAAIRQGENKVRMLQVTPHMADTTPRLTDETFNLRGRMLQVWRVGHYNNAPIEAKWVEGFETPALPREPNVLAHLKRLWTAETPAEEDRPVCHRLEV